MKKFRVYELGKNATLFWDYKRFHFVIGYSYEGMEEQPHLLWIGIAFWTLEFYF
jgi:hypothetical protein